MSKSYFDEALGDFVRDIAYGDAIRHLTNIGYTPSQVKDHLGYPVSCDIIGNLMFKCLCDNRLILLNQPDNSEYVSKESFVCDVDSLGRKSYRKVISKAEKIDNSKYLIINFPKAFKQAPDKYEAFLSALDKSDADYVRNLPWPNHSIYHILNDRMKRIETVYNSIFL